MCVVVYFYMELSVVFGWMEDVSILELAMCITLIQKGISIDYLSVIICTFMQKGLRDILLCGFNTSLSIALKVGVPPTKLSLNCLQFHLCAD